ncbi:MAG: TonB-dependent receptor plug domain-containing protein [Bacteroidales bacterium]
MRKISFFIAAATAVFLNTYAVRAQEGEKTDTISLQEVVVSGSRIETGRNRIPVSVSVLTRDDVKRIDRSNILPEISDRIPGVFVTERGMTGFGVSNGAAGQILIRGVGGVSPNNQVLVLIDGHPQYMGIFGHPLPDAYVASDIEKVEVVKGPASVLYGSAAMAGVVNIITRRMQTEGPSLSARVSYGSFNTQKYMVNGGYRWKKFGVFASINRDHTDGERDSSVFDITNGFVKVSWDPSAHFSVSANFMAAAFTSQDPGPVFHPAPFWVDIKRGQTAFSVENKFEKTQGGLTVFYNFGRHELADGWHSRDGQAGISLYQGVSLFRGNRLTAGIDYKNTGGIGSSGMNANKWLAMDETAGYLFAQQQLFGQVNLSGGIRLEHNSIYGSEWVPQAGATWNPGRFTTLRASASKGFRNPTIMELYLFAPNPDLKPERVWSYEAGVMQKWFGGKINTELTLYMLDGSNFIQVLPNPNPPPPMKRQNAGSVKNQGVEFQMSGMIRSGLSWRAGYSYLHMENLVLAAPQHQILYGAMWKNEKFSVSLDGKTISGLYTKLPAENDPGLQQDFTVLNLRVSWQVVKYTEVFVTGRNLLNANYEIFNGYPMPGINFIGGVTFDLK